MSYERTVRAATTVRPRRRNALFDLRVAEGFRGKGVGSTALRWATAYVFGQFPTIDRIEATTRVDNVAMRRALEANGWVKESHWRKAWRTDSAPVDAVGHGVLRNDFETGTLTAVSWAD